MAEHRNGNGNGNATATASSPKPDVSFPISRPVERGPWTAELDAKLREQQALRDAQFRRDNVLPRAYFPGGDRSLSAIAIRAFLLGTVGATSAFLALALGYNASRLWRPFFFVATLSVFHFLEFWTTAEFNTPIAYVSSFLLTNGDRYRQAHTVALVEAVVTSLFLPTWQARVNPPVVIALGVVMIAVGQVVRSTAMAQAGTNFNHQVQSKKNEGHELVTHGLYQCFRHPSYFGFFWWGIGTQVALGNTFSFIAYTGILWYFFKKRITHEEKHLIQFFGEDYNVYKARTRVWIPFI
ncbi:prenyl cysteine carboxyl methyltransferas-like protein Ste14 [Massarina eburnea CBS 473.64]|uniref:Protein-S-isoprenylcysteine O-methyltransferase n=1 Tax=Massarina eburnea CBS 473.64 TaxID=1395130 RepID=A0A6A6S0P4_9PLEO|nr:prenyl cysteine carboxyl methyltransferas-like protein Ste14 [Massarina eburnea CBS 473.64]